MLIDVTLTWTDSSLRFKEHRKAHYDEYFKIKELREKNSFLDEVSDEDNAELGGKEGCDSSSLSARVEEIDIDGKKDSHHNTS